MLCTLKNQSLFVLYVIFSLPFFQIRATTNPQDELGNTPLHLAVQRGDQIVATQLILHTFLYGDLNAKNHAGETPLHLAVMNGNELIVRLLVEKHADVNEKNKLWETPLHLAVMQGNEFIVRLLLKNYASVGATNKSWETPFHLAVKGGNESIVRFLLSEKRHQIKPDETDNDGLTPLHLAVEEGSESMVRLLVHELYSSWYEKEKQINVQDYEGRTPLHWAVRKGCLAIAELLITHNAQINAKNRFHETPLHWAIESTNIALVELLIKRGAQINAQDHKGFTLLHWAVRTQNIKLVKLLLEGGAQINIKNQEGETPLHWAATLAKKDLMSVLIGYGAQINAKDNKRSIPLHSLLGSKCIIAAHWTGSRNVNEQKSYCRGDRYSLETVELLLEHGADIDAQNTIEATPLHKLAMGGRQDESIMKLLLERGAKINIQNREKRTPLHLAVLFGNKPLAQLLINHGAQINVKDQTGWTPLHLASSHQNEEIAKLLLEHGAKVNDQTDLKNTPLHCALDRTDTVAKRLMAGLVARLLVEHGANSSIPDKDQQTPLDVLLNTRIEDFIMLSFVEIVLYAGVDFDSSFLLGKMLERPIWIGEAESEKKIWANNEDSHTKFTYLIEHYPNLALQILTKILKENNQHGTNDAMITSFVNAACSVFGKLDYFKVIEKLRFFYTNQLLFQWKRNLSWSLRNIFAKKNVDLSLINPKCLEDEVNHLLDLLQVDTFAQSTGAKELQDRMKEQEQIFTQSVCCNLANSFLLNDQKESAQDSIKRICIDSNKLGSASSSLALEFQKLLIKLPKAYSSSNKEAKEKYLLNKLQTVIEFYNYLQSIVELQGKLPDVRNDYQNAQAGFFAGKDILSPAYIEQFMNWCNR